MFSNESEEPRRAVWPKRLAAGLGAVVVTAATAYLAFVLGSIGFDVRRYGQHEGRLERLVKQKPSLGQVVQGLKAEGGILLDALADETALLDVARRRAGPRSEEVVAKGRRWGTVRVFEAGDMIYFLYFDSERVLRDFTCVSR